MMRASVIHPELLTTQTLRDSDTSLEEAVALTRALDVEIVHQDVVRVRVAKGATLFGTGQTAELKDILHDLEVDAVFIDGPLSPIQQRNLEKAWKVKVLDRTGLILEIFADRAQTREGVLQVELAQLTYQKSRLVRRWTHLERQRGGISTVGGAGETQIEADRRAIDDHIVRIQRRLEKVVKTRSLHRAARKKIPYPIVSLVGYTNAGKSTLFNRLTGASVMAKDMLFATLDPTMRAITLPSGREIILSDTVGFISELPTQLVAAFRATLEEVIDADVVVHVRDIAHASTDAQSKDVQKILEDLGLDENDDRPRIEVWNKIDQLTTDHKDRILQDSKHGENVMPMSAVSGQGVDPFLALLDESLASKTRKEVVRLAFAEGKRRAWLFDQNVVEEEQQIAVGFDITVNWTDTQSKRFQTI